MSDEDEKPDRQVENITLDIGKGVKDTTKEGKPSWIPIRELGKGAFGTVYHVVNETTRQEAALKIEQISSSDNLLKIEREIMEALDDETTAIHKYDDGIFNELRFIVMTLCGPDLQKISEQMGHKFRPDTLLRIGIRTLVAIKTLHEKEYVHRDLKPCNFAVDYQQNSLNIYLFDYGMARKFARKEKNAYYLRRPRQNVQFRGTVRYCSPNMHKRKELGRVDDVWSWMFMTMEMFAPLPWGSVLHPDKVEFLKTEHLLDHINKEPTGFLRLFLPIHSMLTSMEYTDRPDYVKLFEILYTKLKEIDGKLSGPMEYDCFRISAHQAEQVETAMKSLKLDPREPPKMEDESTVLATLTAIFNKPGIPGGTKHLLPENVDFFGHFVAPDEKTDDARRKQREKQKEKEKTTKKITTAARTPTPVSCGKSMHGSKVARHRKKYRK